jgi:hypothetical protein
MGTDVPGCATPPASRCLRASHVSAPASTSPPLRTLDEYFFHSLGGSRVARCDVSELGHEVRPPKAEKISRSRRRRVTLGGAPK